MGNRIVISESQYSRLFLNEQQLTGYERAQNQWKKFGAENSETGRNIIEKDVVKYYKDLSDQYFVELGKMNKSTGVGDDFKYDYGKGTPGLDFMDDRGAGRQGALISQDKDKKEKSLYDGKKKENVEKMGKEYPELTEGESTYYQIVKHNENVNEQSKLIPQYCKKPNLTQSYYEFICDNREFDCTTEIIKQKKKSAKGKENVYGKWFTPTPWNKYKIPKYGYYLVFTDNPGKDPWIHCNNETSKGVWVYKTKVGFHCGCMVSQDKKYLSRSGEYDENYMLGFDQKVKDWEKSKEPGFLDSVAQWAGGCTEDFHCVLDVLSIAALALPGVGLAVSAGIDLLNGMSYGVEAYNATNSADRNAAILAGSLTMFGGFVGGGIKQTNKILKYGSIDPKIYEYASDVMSTVQKEYKGAKSLKSIDPTKGLNVLGKKVDPKLSEIYGQAAKKYGLNEEEVILAHDLLKNFSKIDPAIAKQYANALGDLESKIGKGNLVLLGKDKGLKTAIDASGGDIIEGLSKHMGKVARKEAVMEGALFIALTEAMEQPSVQKWIGEKYNMLKYSGRKDIRGLVEKEGYDWENTKEIFMSISTKNPDGSKNDGYSDKQSEQDNSLLKKAWEKGWRPELGRDWLIKNPKYQTKTFKNLLSKPKRIAALRSDDPDFVEKEGVVYLDYEDDVWLTNGLDSDVAKEDTEKSQSILDELLGL